MSNIHFATSYKGDERLITVQNFADMEAQLPMTVAGLATLAFADLCLISEEFLKPVMK